MYVRSLMNVDYICERGRDDQDRVTLHTPSLWPAGSVSGDHCIGTIATHDQWAGARQRETSKRVPAHGRHAETDRERESPAGAATRACGRQTSSPRAPATS